VVVAAAECSIRFAWLITPETAGADPRDDVTEGRQPHKRRGIGHVVGNHIRAHVNSFTSFNPIVVDSWFAERLGSHRAMRGVLCFSASLT
jgi:hypothetical protein